MIRRVLVPSPGEDRYRLLVAPCKHHSYKPDWLSRIAEPLGKNRKRFAFDRQLVLPIHPTARTSDRPPT
jgi:hypothetical protein